MEYLLVGSLVTLIIIPTLYVFYGYSKSSNKEIEQSQLNKVGTDIVDIAEQVYYLGEPSRVTIDETMPEGIAGIEVWKNKELVFFLNDGSEVAFKSKVNITTTQPCIGRCYGKFTERFHSPGLKSIIIEAKKDHVFIREAGDDQTEQEPVEEDKFYCDEDDDSYYAIESSFSCPSGHSDPEQGDDCDDSDYDINPGVDEECDDNKDNDCDGLADCADIVDCPAGTICNEEGTKTCQEGVCMLIIEDCTNGIDDDGDSLVDCNDVNNCPAGTICNAAGTKICIDGPYGLECTLI